MFLAQKLFDNSKLLSDSDSLLLFLVFVSRPDGLKKAYVRLTPDYDSFDLVVNHEWVMV